MATAGEFPKSSGDKLFAEDINDLRRVPQKSGVGAYTLSRNDIGKHVVVTGSVTVPSVSSLVAGDSITVYNPNTTALTITSAGTTTVIAGTTVTPVLIFPNGLATFLCVSTSPPKFVVIGGGIT
jgi:hypothetical protein